MSETLKTSTEEEMKEWCLARLSEMSGEQCMAVMDIACAEGYMGLVKAMHDSGCVCSCRAMDEASANGHLEVVEFLDKNRTEGAPLQRSVIVSGMVTRRCLDTW